LILILDFGGKCGRVVGRIIRESKVYCEILPYNTSIEKIKEKDPQGIILTGDAEDEKVARIDKNIPKLDLPTIGMGCKNQILTKEYGIQTYPESEYNENNKRIVENFLFKVCECKPYWDMKDFVDNTIKDIKEKVGNGKALCGLSGGVDSTVAAVLVHEAIGDNLVCVFVDNGLLRKNEVSEVESFFKDRFDMNIITVDAKDRFLNELKGVIEPEQKRKVIGEEFIRVFEEEQKKLTDIDFLVQGTIYQDVIESGCDEHTVVGAVAKNYAGKKVGDSVFDPVFVLAAVLEWAGIAHNGRGELVLTQQYLNNA